MQTLYGQSIAVGNLGNLALLKHDHTTARTCFEQHLQLVQALLDPEAEVNAWVMLAKLCNSEENFLDALENLEQARKIAARCGLMLCYVSCGAVLYYFIVCVVLRVDEEKT